MVGIDVIRNGTLAVPADEWSHRFRVPRQPYFLQDKGSGVILDTAGHIVTNCHVVRGAVALKVKLADGRTFDDVKLVGADPLTDVAVLKIDAAELTPAQWGDSDAVDVGDPVLAVGNPFGFSQTVSTGIVSAVGRSDVGILDYESFVQTDASINQGNSGGPLVNLKGEIVGINTAIYSSVSGGNVGIGFAIPINLAKALVNRWIEGKNSSYLGIIPLGCRRERPSQRRPVGGPS